MTPEFIMGLARQAIETMLMISLPIILSGLIVGLLVSIFQSVTQIQEATLSFVPKIVVTFLALLFFGSWMITKMCDFAREVLQRFPNWIQ